MHPPLTLFAFHKRGRWAEVRFTYPKCLEKCREIACTVDDTHDYDLLGLYAIED